MNPMIIVYILCGGVCGWFSSQLIEVFPAFGFIGGLAICVIILYASMILQFMIHEGGHLVCGLLSGYKFVSYRIGSLMLIRENGKLVLKRFSLAGTGGQCLMEPPELKDGKIPVLLYNLGGVLANLLSSLVAFILYLLFRQYVILGTCLIIFAVLGVGLALGNGIPFTSGLVNNDGYNAKNLGKNPDALKAFRISLMANVEQLKGKTLSEMPSEWFEMPEDEKLHDALTASLAVYACNVPMEQKHFQKAMEMIESLLSKDTAILGLHRVFLINDLIYCKIVLGREKDEIRKLLDKQQLKMMKAMKGQPAFLRTQYAVELLVDEAPAKAEKTLEAFRKLEKKYPYASDYHLEESYVEVVKKMNSGDGGEYSFPTKMNSGDGGGYSKMNSGDGGGYSL